MHSVDIAIIVFPHLLPAGEWRKQRSKAISSDSGIAVKAVWHIVKESAKRIGVAKLAPHDLRRTCARLCHASGGELEQIQFLWSMSQFKRPNDILAASSAFDQPSMIALASSRIPELGAWWCKG